MAWSRKPAVTLAAAMLVAAPATLGPAGAEASQPARVQVVEKEYLLTLSRTHLRAGKAIVQVINFGMDNHDLVLQRNAKGSKPIKFDQLAPGAHATRTLQLIAGRYILWCSLPGHRQQGMVTTLIVN